MRLPSRLLAATLLAVGVVSCSDTRTINTPIPAGKHAGRIALNPVFSSAAHTISASLADFGITFDHVRVTIRNNPDTTVVVADTTIAFGATSENLTLDLTVPVDVDGEIFNALVQYTGPSGVVYSGSILVQSHAADQPAPEQQTLVLNFVGPGAKLKTITLSPKPVNLVGSQSLPVTVTATDSSGASIAVPPLVFTSSDASVATISGSGGSFVAQSFGKRGQVRITASTPIGISDTLSANVTLPASAIVLVSGGGQTGAAGTALTNPAVVQVNAADGVGVPGVSVTFAPPVNGSVGTTTATTDANGRASTTLTLAPGTGAQSFLATAATFNVPIPETAVAGPASLTASTISTSVGSIKADNTSSAVVTVQLRDQYGNALTTGGATVTLVTTLGHWGSIGAATSINAVDHGNGTYTGELFSSRAGTATISAALGEGSLTATAAVTISAIPPAAIVLVSGGGQTGAVGTALTNPAVVQVNSADGVGIPDVTVSFTAPSGASVAPATATTDASGKASAVLTLASATGAQSFSAATGTFSVAIPETAVAGAISAAKTGLSATSPIVADNSTASTVTVQARDQFGNVITTGGATVSLSTTLGHFGAGTATTTTATDNKDGTYTALLLSPVGGTATVSGSIGSAALANTAAVTFVAGTLDHFDVTNPDGSAIGPTVPAGTPFAVKITARDATNNVIPSYTGQPKVRVTNSYFTLDSVVVAPAAVSGVTTVNITLGTTGQNVTLDVTGTLGQTTKTSHSAPFTVTTGAAARLATSGPGDVVVNDFDSQPTSFPVISVTDGAGNPVSGQTVSFQILAVDSRSQSPRCSVAGSAFTTDAQGLITFDNQSLNMTADTNLPFSCVLLATATNATGQPLSGSPLSIALLIRPSNTSLWTGKAHDHSWTDPGNWVGSVPTSTTPVFVPMATTTGTAQTPVLAANAAVGSIDVEDAAQIDLGGHTLTSVESIQARTIGTIANGTVSTAAGADGGSISGILPNVVCTSGTYSVTDILTVTGSFANSGCSLYIGGYPMAVQGNFTQSGSGIVALNGPSDVLSITGNATFGGGPESDLLANGQIVVGGSFTQSGDAKAFATSYLQHTYFSPLSTSAPGPRTISLGAPSASKFTYLDMLLTPASPITVQSMIEVDSVLTITAPTGGSFTLANGLVNTRNGPITINAVGLTLDIHGIVNGAGLNISSGTSVTLNANSDANLAMANGFITLGANSHFTINGTGTVSAAGCSKGSGVVIDGNNTAAVAFLNSYCTAP